MVERIKSFAIFILIVIICFMSTCHGRNSNDCREGTKLVTWERKIYIDTVPFPLAVPRIVPFKKEVLVPKLVYDTVGKLRAKEYNIAFEDSLLKGEVFARVNPDSISLDTLGFKYIPKFPKYIYRVDSITKTIETIKIKDYWAVYAGANLLLRGNGEVSVMPLISLKTKRDLVLSVGYDPITRTKVAGVKTFIFRSKK